MITDEIVDNYVNSPWQMFALIAAIFVVILAPLLFGVWMTEIGYALVGELILASTGMMFNLFLLSSLYDKDTVIPVTSSIPYATLLFIRIVSYGMVGLWIPAAVSAIGGCEWVFLCVFRNNIDYE